MATKDINGKENKLRQSDIAINAYDDAGNVVSYLVQPKRGPSRTIKAEYVDNNKDFHDANYDLINQAKSSRKTSLGDQPEMGPSGQRAKEYVPTLNAPEGDDPANAPDPNAVPAPQMQQELPPMPMEPQYATTTSSQWGKNTNTQTKELDDNAKEALRKKQEADDAAHKLSIEGAKLAASNSSALATEQEKIAANNMLNVMADQRAAAEMQADYKQAWGKAQDVMEKARQMQVDPNNMWQNMSDGRKAAAALSIIVGGLGQALAGSKSNAAWDVFDKAVERDIDAQMENIKNARLSSQDLVVAAQEMRQMYRNETDVRKALTAAKYQVASDNLSALATRNAGTEKGTSLLAAAEVAKSKQQQLEIELGTTAKTVSRSSQGSSQTVPMKPVESKMGDISNDMRKDLTAKYESYQAAEKLSKLWSDPSVRAGSGPIMGQVRETIFKRGFTLPGHTPEQTMAIAAQKSTLGRFVRSISGAATTDAEREFYAQIFPRLGASDEINQGLIKNLVTEQRTLYEDTRKRAGLAEQGASILQQFPAAASMGGGDTEDKKAKYGGKSTPGQ